MNEDLIIEDVTESEAEKRRRLWRERKRKQRIVEREQKTAQHTEDESEWWTRNRALLSPTELAALLTQDALCKDFIVMMDYAGKHNVSLVDLDYVFEKDCLAAVVEFVKQNPCPHLGYIHRDQNIPSDWDDRKYWQDPSLLERLSAEGPATESFVKYGLLSSIPDWRVERFLMDKAKWPWMKVAALLGQGIDSRDLVKYR
jgi:hypothetical protein